MNTITKESLKPKSEISSTRLMAHRSLLFFFVINGLIITTYLVTGFLAVLHAIKTAAPVEFKFFIDTAFILEFDLLLLASIYAPKSFNKTQEIKVEKGGEK